MKTPKELTKLLSTELAMLPGPLTQEDTRDQMSRIVKNVTGLRMLSQKHDDATLKSQVADIEKTMQKLQGFISKLPKRQ